LTMTVGRPLTGARIETCVPVYRWLIDDVAPSRGRGLKRWGRGEGLLDGTVAPSRGRGLKRRPARYPRRYPRSPPHGGAD